MPTHKPSATPLTPIKTLTTTLPTPPFPPSTIPTLHGRSNFTLWHTAIRHHLTTHSHSHALLADTETGTWPEPLHTTHAAAGETHISWEHANLSLCRFIRATLAMNVLPFVRRYTEAKALWEALLGLYGEGNGIVRVGGGTGTGMRIKGGDEKRGGDGRSMVEVQGKGKGKLRSTGEGMG